MNNIWLSLFFVLFATQVQAQDTTPEDCPMNFSEVGLCAKLSWLDGPYLNQISQFEVHFWQTNDTTKSTFSPPQDVKIYTRMVMDKGHDHGGPAIHTEEMFPGVFRVLDARFIGGMMGYWKVNVDLFDENKNLISRADHRVKIEDDHTSGIGDGDHHGHHHH